jgi:hypothetical protein
VSGEAARLVNYIAITACGAWRLEIDGWAFVIRLLLNIGVSKRQFFAFVIIVGLA